MEAYFVNDMIGQPRYIGSSKQAKEFVEKIETKKIKPKDIKFLSDLEFKNIYDKLEKKTTLEYEQLNFSKLGYTLNDIKYILKNYGIILIFAGLVATSLTLVGLQLLPHEEKGKVYFMYHNI
jgi:hypothetical protein